MTIHGGGLSGFGACGLALWALFRQSPPGHPRICIRTEVKSGEASEAMSARSKSSEHGKAGTPRSPSRLKAPSPQCGISLSGAKRPVKGVWKSSKPNISREFIPVRLSMAKCKRCPQGRFQSTATFTNARNFASSTISGLAAGHPLMTRRPIRSNMTIDISPKSVPGGQNAEHSPSGQSGWRSALTIPALAPTNSSPLDVGGCHSWRADVPHPPPRHTVKCPGRSHHGK